MEKNEDIGLGETGTDKALITRTNPEEGPATANALPKSARRVPVAAGVVIGHVTVLSLNRRVRYESIWNVRCRCGGERQLRTSNVQRGLPCLACVHARRADIRKRTISTQSSWWNMKGRCLNPRNANYAKYGGRGITVCERWLSFANFIADMGPRPAGTTIDRFPDRDGSYEPGNCRWATVAEQNMNKNTTKVDEAGSMQIAWLINDGGFSSEVVAQAFGIARRTADHYAMIGRRAQ